MSSKAKRMISQVSIWPREFVAGGYATWGLSLEIGPEGIQSGSAIRITPSGNPIVRPPGQTSLPAEENYISVYGPNSVRLKAASDPWLEVSLNLVEGELRAGDITRIVYGDQRWGSPGLRLKGVASELRFRISVSPGDDELFSLDDHPTLYILPDKPSQLLLRAQSTIRQDGECWLMAHLVDQHGNTVRDCSGGVYFFPIGGFEIPSDVRWQSQEEAVAHSSCQLKDNQPVERIRFRAVAPTLGFKAVSNPVEVNLAEEAESIYWGDLHCHTNLEQGLESPEFLYDYAKNVEHLDFVGHVEHNWDVPTRWTGHRWRDWQGVSDVQSYNEATWEYRKELVQRFYEPGKFVPLLCNEWASSVYGHMNIYYPDDDGPLIYPPDRWKAMASPNQVWEQLEGQEAIVVPHHTSSQIGPGRPKDGRQFHWSFEDQNPASSEEIWSKHWGSGGFDWTQYNSNFMRLVEIYSKHGSSEYFSCPRAVRDQQADGCVQQALNMGCKLGFVAGSDSHATRPGSSLAYDLTYRQGGLTAVFAPKLDRPSIYAALRARRCYATTGQRIIVRFWVNGAFMGEEIELDDPEMYKEIHFDVAGVGPLSVVEVVKDGSVIYRYDAQSASQFGWWRDNGWERENWVLDKEPTLTPSYYYLRVIQQNGEMAWSSPVWTLPPSN